jgi:hypothetical protein
MAKPRHETIEPNIVFDQSFAVNQDLAVDQSTVFELYQPFTKLPCILQTHKPALQPPHLTIKMNMPPPITGNASTPLNWTTDPFMSNKTLFGQYANILGPGLVAGYLILGGVAGLFVFMVTFRILRPLGREGFWGAG